MQSSRPQVLSFLDAIKETPDDDTPRLILADWLMEHGDEVRGEFIQLQCRLAQMNQNDPQWGETSARIEEILQKQELGWLGPFRPLLRQWQFHRGLLRATVNCPRLVKAADRAAGWTESWAWMDRVKLRDTSISRLFREFAFMQQVTGLDLGADWRLGDDGLETLTSSPHLTRLISLYLDCNQISTTGMAILAQSPLLGQLTELSLRGNVIDDGGFALLVSSPQLRLRRLDLGANVLRLTNRRALALLPKLCQLSSLSLSDNHHLEPEVIKSLTRINWSRLTELSLDHTGIDDEGARALAQAPGLSRLTALSLIGNKISVEGAIALAESPYLGDLRRLWLWRNSFSSGAAAALRARFGNAVLLD